MTSRCKRIPLLPLFSCLLTALASGDDFCWPRLMFAVPSTSAARLPMDDPNTDFVESADPWSAQRSDRDTADRTATVACYPAAFGAALARCSPALPGPLAGHPDPSDSALNTPLRC
jgi:hypothetical protein